MKSVWTDGTARQSTNMLNGNISTDVLIVGGGIAGVLCAYRLQKEGIDCVLVEADTIGCGITKNSTAKITLQHGLIYDKLITQFGTEKAQMYLAAQKKACDEYERLCKSISCDYEIKDSYVYSLDERKKIEKEVSAYHKLHEDAEFIESTALPFSIAGAVKIKNQAQFNPLQFVYEISKNLKIYEHTKVRELMPYKAITSHAEIKCRKMIIATHFPILNKHGGYSLKLYQHRSYVTALTGAQDVDGMYVDEYDKGLSFRNYGKFLLLGGGAHRTGKKGGNWNELQEFAQKYYPSAKAEYKWATQDCMTLDGIPYIGKYSEKTPDLFVATGFNKWGISSSMVSAMILADMVQGRENEYAPVFSPSRSMLRVQLAVNIFESLAGILTPSVPRCPHLGCALKYNPDEHSWDCPCHGSRFSENGELIDNPATADKKI